MQTQLKRQCSSAPETNDSTRTPHCPPCPSPPARETASSLNSFAQPGLQHGIDLERSFHLPPTPRALPFRRYFFLFGLCPNPIASYASTQEVLRSYGGKGVSSLKNGPGRRWTTLLGSLAKQRNSRKKFRKMKIVRSPYRFGAYNVTTTISWPGLTCESHGRVGKEVAASQTTFTSCSTCFIGWCLSGHVETCWAPAAFMELSADGLPSATHPRRGRGCRCPPWSCPTS